MKDTCTCSSGAKATDAPKPLKVVLFVVLLVGLMLEGSLGVALLAGMIFALILGNPQAHWGKKLSKVLFQGCVVLLGFGMDLEKILHAGASGLMYAAVTISGTLIAGFLIGRVLGVGKKTSALIASGTAICGGSAIAAVGPVIAASEAEMAIAVGAIFLLNAAALFLFPAIGGALHLTQHQFGIWAGIGIHDISSVVGAASAYGNEALQTATAVKLSRALWIVPLTLGMGAVMARRSTAHGKSRPKVAVPWFIALFLLASVLRSFVPEVAQWAPQVGVVAKEGMIVALALIGASISPATLRTLGWRVGVQAVLLWVFISITALVIAVVF
ncbi:MAG: YeiH family protein [Chthoniobacteraceae bacterium]